MSFAPKMAGAILREQIGGRYDFCFQQGGKESPCLFNLVMKSIFKTLQEKWQEVQMEIRTQRNWHQHERDRITRMIFADNCYIFAEKREQMLNIIEDATLGVEKKGQEWKEGQMELISWRLNGEVGDLCLKDGGKECDQES